MQQSIGTLRSTESVLATNRVLRNTYALLSMTLIFSAFTAWMAMRNNMQPMNWMVMLGVYFGLLFVTTKLRNSAWGIVSVFALTGFLGLTIGPIVNLITQSFSNGNEIVMMALGGTGITFLALSGFALTTKRDFSGIGKFLMVGILVAFLASIANIFFQIPALALAVSGMFIMLMAGLILYQTQQIMNRGETNYIMATVTLYIAIYNIFMSLLHLLTVLNGDD